jgi:hypothetical protein
MPNCTVLSLTELDEPFMTTVTQDKMDGFKTLVKATFISKSLLQHQILDHFHRTGDSDEFMWSSEPEIFLEKGEAFIHRLYLNEKQNMSINSSRRAVMADVNPEKSVLRLVPSANSLQVEQVSALELMSEGDANDKANA